MMPALIISTDMIDHDASFYTDQICSDNFASPFPAGVMAGKGIVSDVLLQCTVGFKISGRRLRPSLAFGCWIEIEGFISYLM